MVMTSRAMACFNRASLCVHDIPEPDEWKRKQKFANPKRRSSPWRKWDALHIDLLGPIGDEMGSTSSAGPFQGKHTICGRGKRL
jgi:hypothetical protein